MMNLLARTGQQKYRKLRNDVKSAVTHETGIQILLLSEFGNMFNPIDSELACGVTQTTGETIYCTRKLFENLLADIDLPHIHVIANAPYVALIDTQCWRARRSEVLSRLCSNQSIRVQHVILEHVDTSKPLRCFNCHIPTKFGTMQRKQDCVKKMCDMATDTGVQQPSACMPWIIAEDLNSILVRWLNGANPSLRKASNASLNQQTTQYHKELLWFISNRGWRFTINHVHLMRMMLSS